MLRPFSGHNKAGKVVGLFGRFHNCNPHPTTFNVNLFLLISEQGQPLFSGRLVNSCNKVVGLFGRFHNRNPHPTTFNVSLFHLLFLLI